MAAKPATKQITNLTECVGKITLLKEELKSLNYKTDKEREDILKKQYNEEVVLLYDLTSYKKYYAEDLQSMIYQYMTDNLLRLYIRCNNVQFNSLEGNWINDGLLNLCSELNTKMKSITPKVKNLHSLVYNITHYSKWDHLQLFINVLPEFYELLDESSNMLFILYYDFFICHNATEQIDVIINNNINGLLCNIETKVDRLINHFKPHEVEGR